MRAARIAKQRPLTPGPSPAAGRGENEGARGACARLRIVEADAAFFGRAGRRRHQLPDGFEDDLEVLVVLAEFLFHFFEFGGEVFMSVHERALLVIFQR